MLWYYLLLFVFITSVASACSCNGDECGCCVLIDVPKIGIDDQGCLNITYIPETLSLSLTFWLDGQLLVNETVSAENPDICLPIPIVKNFVDICFDFTNLHVTGCVAVAFTFLDITVASFSLGCFDIPVLFDPSSPIPGKAQDNVFQ